MKANIWVTKKCEVETADRGFLEIRSCKAAAMEGLQQ
jgi:hypothetical protein